MPEDLRLAPLGAEHLAACLALDRACFSGLWSESQWLRELEDPRRPGMGVFLDGTLLALASGWLVVDELHITVVAVGPAWRRRGLGRRALAALLEQGRALGAQRATLEVGAGNSAARALYAGAGFREAGVRHGYYRNGDDALIQWRNLTREAGAGNR
ncbi:MAG: GNAT family N-acetyltransferase [Cyanobium sp.]